MLPHNMKRRQHRHEALVFDSHEEKRIYFACKNNIVFHELLSALHLKKHLSFMLKCFFMAESKGFEPSNR